MMEIFKTWLRAYRYHLLVWACFIVYESVVIGLVYGAFGEPLAYVFHYALIISLFYCQAELVLPWALKNSKKVFWRLPLIMAVEISTFIIISFGEDKILELLESTGKAPLMLTIQYALKSLYRGIYFMGFATGYYFLVTYNKEKRKTEELEKQRLIDIIYRQKTEQELTKAQNAFLKAQINPHFLFNTLDFVYHHTVALSPTASEAIIVLAEMMRYAIDSDKMGDFVRLGDEIEQAENLIFLHQLRKDDELCITLEYDEAVKEVYLIPLVLLTLMENIFKHADLTRKEYPAIVRLRLSEGTLLVETNNLVNQYNKPDGHRSGLINIAERIRYAYGLDATFVYGANETGRFTVTLEVPPAALAGAAGSSGVSKHSDTTSLHAFAGQYKTGD